MKENNITSLLFDNDDQVVLADADDAAYITRKHVEEYRKYGRQ